MESHVGKANGCGSYGDFPTISAGGIVKFFSEISDDLWDRLNLIIHKKLSQFDCHILGNGSVSIIDKLLGYNCITMTQHT